MFKHDITTPDVFTPLM